MTCTSNGFVVRIGGKKHDGALALLANTIRGLHAVHCSFEPYVHQHEIRAGFQGKADRILTPDTGPEHLVPDALELLLYIPGNDPIIFQDEYSRGSHEGASAWSSVRNETENAVPPSFATVTVPCNCSARS